MIIINENNEVPYDGASLNMRAKDESGSSLWGAIVN